MKRLIFTLSVLGIVLAGCASNTPTGTSQSKPADPYDSATLNQLCYGYIYGQNGYQKDYVQALKWCQQGADAGDANSQTLLAELYHFGEGVTKDDAVAGRWYFKAARHGHVHAELMLAMLQFTKTPPDLDTLCYWLTKASNDGYDKAQETLDKLETEWKREHPEATKAFCDRDFSNVQKE